MPNAFKPEAGWTVYHGACYSFFLGSFASPEARNYGDTITSSACSARLESQPAVTLRLDLYIR